ncbi:MAG TPA: transposase [Candidatus Obscuribacterales bacterium]
MPKVIGADICKNRLIFCCLESEPIDPKEQFWQTEFNMAFLNVEGLHLVLAHNPDVVVIEPTGVHYARLWIDQLAAHGIKVVLVHNNRLPKFRSETLNFPDKDDEIDAYALACYWFRYNESSRRFVQQRDPIIVRLREINLTIRSYNHIQNRIFNRIKQQLCWQFPEVSDRITMNAPLFFRWLAGISKSERYDNLLSKSIASSPITEELKFEARELSHYMDASKKLEIELESILMYPEFDSYRKVFKEFELGLKLSAMLLSYIYPIEDFLKDGKPEVVTSRGRISKKPTKKYLSLRRFRKAIGVANTREDSGDKKKSRRAGSGLCREQLFLWSLRTIERNRSPFLKTELGKKLRGYLEIKISKGKHRNKARACLISKMAELLFNALVTEIVTDN